MRINVLIMMAVLSCVPSAFAQTSIYKNQDGCTVEVEARRNGTIYYVSAGENVEVLGVTNDLRSGTFAFCDDSVLEVHSLEGSQGVGVMLSCSAHQNGHATTRGQARIDIIKGELKELSIDGQIKGFFGWKQDTKVVCLNLKKQ